MTTLRALFILTISLCLAACATKPQTITLDRTGTRVNTIVAESANRTANGELWSLSDVDQKTLTVFGHHQIEFFDRTTWLGSIRLEENQFAFIRPQSNTQFDWPSAQRQPIPTDRILRLASILNSDAALSQTDRDIQLITRYLEPLRRMKTQNTTTQAATDPDTHTYITWSTLGGNRFKIRMISFLKQTGMIKEFFFRDDQLIATHTQFCKRTGDPSVIDEIALITLFSLDRYYKDGAVLHSFVLPGIPQLGMPEDPATTQPAEDLLNQPDNSPQLATWLIQHWGQDQLNLENWIMHGKP